MGITHILGPWAQLFFFLALSLPAGGLLCAASFCGERRLIQTKNRLLWTLPLPTLSICLLYGAMRFSGLLVYAGDGWDASGRWNYTNQNAGASVLFLCGCLLAGTALAVYKEKPRLMEH